MALPGVSHAGVHRADTERIALVRRIVVAGVSNFGNTTVDHSNLRVAIAAGGDVEGASERGDRADGHGRHRNVEIAALNDPLIGPDLAGFADIGSGGRETGGPPNVRPAEADPLPAGRPPPGGFRC